MTKVPVPSASPMLSAGAERVRAPSAPSPHSALLAPVAPSPPSAPSSHSAPPPPSAPSSHGPPLPPGTDTRHTDTRSPHSAAYDVVIIGAGPAGTLAAILLARRNLSVLLVDRAAAWPRDKPCGGCLDAQANTLLKLHRLDHLLTHTHPISRASLHHRGRTVSAYVAHAHAISRSLFDAALVQEFQRIGGTFRHATAATVPTIPEDAAQALPRHAAPARLARIGRDTGNRHDTGNPRDTGKPVAPSTIPSGTRVPPTHDDRSSRSLGLPPVFRDVLLTYNGTTETVRTHLILVADGLAGTSLTQHPWASWHIAPNSHLGIAATLPNHAGLADPHTIHMHVAPEGYVGLVRLPAADDSVGDGSPGSNALSPHDGSAVLHLGAALSPVACRTHGGPAAVLRRILRASAGLTLPDGIVLKGTPLLTRRRPQLGTHRLLTLGDACAYVEPFTGQGIGWALRSAHEAVSLLVGDAIASWPTGLHHAWTTHYAKTLTPQQRPCRAIRALLRNDTLTSLAASLIEALPDLPKRITVLQPM